MHESFLRVELSSTILCLTMSSGLFKATLGCCSTGQTSFTREHSNSKEHIVNVPLGICRCGDC